MAAARQRGGGDFVPGPLVWFHLIVFGGFAASAVAAAFPELAQLRLALAHRWHPGTPPLASAVVGAALAALGLAALVVRVVRQKGGAKVPSAVVLLGFFLALTVELQAPTLRSQAGANMAFLDVAKAVHLAMRDHLQREGAAPADGAAWQAELERAGAAQGLERSPYRSRWFRAQPWRVVMLAAEAQVPKDEPPGTLAVWVSRDRVQYRAALVGLSSRLEAARLRDGAGGLVELEGVYNPDMGRRPVP